jgi:hypothetical protein
MSQVTLYNIVGHVQYATLYIPVPSTNIYALEHCADFTAN